jgi:putative transcriptional regulator
MIETSYLTNQFLIAMPNLDHPDFFQTVTYICQHNQEGAMGIVINRPLEIDLGVVFQNMDIESHDLLINNTAVFEGGLVEPERGFVIHQSDQKWDVMMNINNDFSLTTSRDIVNAMADGKGPKNALIALGYCGWGAGQLEEELADNIWLTTPANQNIIFDTPPAERWHAAAASIGIDINLLSTEAGHS